METLSLKSALKGWVFPLRVLRSNRSILYELSKFARELVVLDLEEIFEIAVPFFCSVGVVKHSSFVSSLLTLGVSLVVAAAVVSLAELGFCLSSPSGAFLTLLPPLFLFFLPVLFLAAVKALA